MESVRICCAGYPTRRPIDRFVERYHLLNLKLTGESPKALVPILLQGLIPEDQYKLGLTKIFLRAGQVLSNVPIKDNK